MKSKTLKKNVCLVSILFMIIFIITCAHRKSMLVQMYDGRIKPFEEIAIIKLSIHDEVSHTNASYRTTTWMPYISEIDKIPVKGYAHEVEVLPGFHTVGIKITSQELWRDPLAVIRDNFKPGYRYVIIDSITHSKFNSDMVNHNIKFKELIKLTTRSEYNSAEASKHITDYFIFGLLLTVVFIL